MAFNVNLEREVTPAGAIRVNSRTDTWNYKPFPKSPSQTTPQMDLLAYFTF